MTAKEKYELDYWETVVDKDFEPRYMKAIELFKITGNQGRILDYGCGMFNGILPYVEADFKYAYDPLAKYYMAMRTGSWDAIDDVPPLIRKFDNIVSINVIDHDDMNFSMLHYFSSLLVPGGNLYLHVDLREANQLNFGHDHQLTESDYLTELAKSDFIEVFRTIGPDPLPEPGEQVTSKYNSLMCHLKKKS